MAEASSAASSATSSRAFLPALLYGSMIAGVVLAFFWILNAGEKIIAPAAAIASGGPLGAAGSGVDDLLHVLLALAVVIVTARTLGAVFRRGRQPPVIGEIVAGILLGPSLLGRLAPAASAYLFPPAMGPFLDMISQVGIILYMFLVGLELDPSLLRRRGHATVAISHASIIAPFLSGAALALALYPKLSNSGVPFTNFALFLGVSMAVTAFPVLARILTDRRIQKTRVGAIALTCAAVDDVTAWCLLAFVVSVARAETAGAARTAAMAIAYIAAMLLVVRPAMERLSRLYGNRGRLTQGLMAALFVMLLLSSFATELIGIHAVFGAFALGAVIPHDSGMARELGERLEDIVIVLLLPAFFAFTGLRTQLGLVSGAEQWMLCGAIIAVASMGKFGGSVAAARIAGIGWRDASALGILMNTRGLMELIVLNIGLDMGIISPTLFAMLVIMALATTLATTPILHLIMRREPLEEEAAARQPAAPHLSEIDRSAILVPVANPQGVAPLVDLALAATPPDAPPPRVLALVRRPLGGVRLGLRAMNEAVAPRSAALAAALEMAWSRGEVITPQAVWSDDPASDILRTAEEPQIRWVMLGPHRAVFGSDFTGGLVREILERARALPLSVGVVIHGGETRFTQVYALADSSYDGVASIELAARIAARKDCDLRVMLTHSIADDTDPALTAILDETARMLGLRLHTEVLPDMEAVAAAGRAADGLVIMGTNTAARIGLSSDGSADGRMLVIVQGAQAGPRKRNLVRGYGAGS
jgi:Kef-type K+ transport system membrane component KefB